MEHEVASATSLSRRQALKTLAALTGAAALSGLPNSWGTPQIAVGALPAQAQTPSGLWISSDSVELTYELDDAGGGDETNSYPTLNLYVTFNYANDVGGVTLMRLDFDWTDGGGGQEGSGGTCVSAVTEHNPTCSGGVMDDTIEDFMPCSNYASVAIYIEDGSGQTSNTVSGTLNIVK